MKRGRILTATLPLSIAALGTWFGGAAAVAISSQGQHAGLGLTNLAACVAGNHRLDVDVMMDESGSLGSPSDGMPATDPENKRVPALQELLAGLTDLSAGTHPVKVEVQLQGFSSYANIVMPFGRLDARSLAKFDSAAAKFATRDTGLDTDFWEALHGVQTSLAREQAAQGGDACSAFVLFTDGFYSFSVRPGVSRPYAPGLNASTSGSASALIKAGHNAICQPGGLADQLRNSQVFAITVGLGPGSTVGASFLRGISGGGGCGDATGPGGLFLPASDVGTLLQDFLVIGAEIDNGNPIGSLLANPRSFYLSSDLRMVKVVATTTKVVGVKLTDPAGSSKLLSTTTPTILDGLSFELSTPTVGYYEVVGSPTTPSRFSSLGNWRGLWSINFESRARTGVQTQVVEFADLKPVVSALTHFSRSGNSVFAFNFQRFDGGAAPIAELASPHVALIQYLDPSTSHVIATQELHNTQLSVGSVAENVNISSDKSPTVEIRIRVESLDPLGRELTIESSTFYGMAAIPASYPSIAQSTLIFGSVPGSRAAHANITIDGGSEGGGCLQFLGFSATTLPQGVTDPQVQLPASCIPVAKGGSRIVTLTLTHSGQGWGSLTGSLSADARASSGAPLPIDLPVSAAFWIPISNVRRLLLFIALLCGGVLVPLGVMYGLAAVSARFRPTAGLSFVQIDVTVSNSSVVAISGSAFSSSSLVTKIRPIPESEVHARRINIPNGPMLTSSVVANPFASARTIATSPTGDVVASGGSHLSGNQWIGDLTPDLSTGWTFEVMSKETTEAGDLSLKGVLTLFGSAQPGESPWWKSSSVHAQLHLVEYCEMMLPGSQGVNASVDSTLMTPATATISPDDPRATNLFDSES